jgi:hypothetical protein
LPGDLLEKKPSNRPTIEPSTLIASGICDSDMRRAAWGDTIASNLRTWCYQRHGLWIFTSYLWLFTSYFMVIYGYLLATCEYFMDI